MATSPEELMRSRYAAFALGRGKYLVETLASAHPDLATPRAALERELGRARERQRFMGLSVLHAAANGDEGEVLFFVRIFERGRELSFAELSSFVREDGAWRYLSGIALPKAKLGDDPTALDRESFLALANEAG